MKYNPYDAMRGMNTMNAAFLGGMMGMNTEETMEMNGGNNSGIVIMLQKVVSEMEEMREKLEKNNCSLINIF